MSDHGIWPGHPREVIMDFKRLERRIKRLEHKAQICSMCTVSGEPAALKRYHGRLYCEWCCGPPGDRGLPGPDQWSRMGKLERFLARTKRPTLIQVRFEEWLRERRKARS